MTLFAADQQATARAIRAACMVLGHGNYPTVLACLTCNGVEASFRNPSTGDISVITQKQSTSMGCYQQTDGYGPAADRMNILTATRMFLEGRAKGNGGDAKLGYLQTNPNRSLPFRVQDVQQSQYDGKPHTNPITHKVETLAFASNYIETEPLAVELLALIGGVVPPRYPGAWWRPTGSGNGKMPGNPNACSFHEAVTRAESVFGWVQTAHACQAFIGQHGTAEQFAEWDDWMYGVSDGNSHVITIESFDGLLIQSNPYREIGMGGVYGDSANTGRWDDGQLERFADLSAFLHLEVGIPIVASARAGDPGFGPHRLGIEPWRSSMYGSGEVWTQHADKPCPGNLRILQIPGILARAKVIADAVAAGRCGYLPTGPVDMSAALARTGTTPPPDPGELTMDAEATKAFQAVNDKVDKLTKLITDAVGDGQASFASTIKALLHLVQGDQNLDAQDLKVDQATLAQQQANANALNRVEKQTAAKPVVTIAPAPGPVA